MLIHARLDSILDMGERKVEQSGSWCARLAHKPAAARWTVVALLWLLGALALPVAVAAPDTSVVANPTSIGEESQAGTFTVNVTDSAFPCGASEVRVLLGVRGTATLGSDYTLAGSGENEVAVPMTLLDSGSCEGEAGTARAAGQATLTLTSLADDLVEGDETATLDTLSCEVTGWNLPLSECDASATMTILDGALVARIEASDPTASKQTRDPGEFLITLSRPAPEGGVTVLYGVTGTAQAGVDYIALPGSILIPAGQTTGRIQVTPISSGASGATSTRLVATLRSGQDYAVGTPASAEVVITGDAIGLTAVSGNGQVVIPGQSLAPFTVRVTGATGTAVGLVVLWSIDKGDGALSSTRSVTDSKGEASTTLTPGTDPEYQVRATLEVNGVSVLFSALASPLSSLPGLSEAERSMASALESLCPRLGAIGTQRALTAGEQDLLTQCSTLISSATTDPSAAAQGVAALTPEQASAPRKLATEISSIQVKNITARLKSLRQGTRGISLQGLTASIGDQQLSATRVADTFGQLIESGGGASADEPFPFERLGIFITGDLQWGSKDQASNEDGFDFQTTGITAGADYRFAEGLILGAALGYANTDTDVDSNLGTINSNSWSASVYGTYYVTEHLYLEGSANYGWDSYDQDRNIAYSLLGNARQAKADYDGRQYTLMFGAGYDLISGSGILDLYGRVRYTNASLDDYTETGANGLDLVIRGQDATSFKSILGVQFSRAISTRRAVLVPQGWVEWEHEFEQGDDSVEGYFVNDPNRFLFILPTAPLDTDAFRVGLGLGAQFAKGRTAFISYQAATGLNDYTEQLITAGVRLEF